jgi:hypothetical protein
MTSIPLLAAEKTLTELYWFAHLWNIGFDMLTGKDDPIFAPVLLIVGALAAIESDIYPVSKMVFTALVIGHALRALSRWTALFMPSMPRMEQFFFHRLPKIVSFVEFLAVLWFTFSPCLAKNFFDVFQYVVTALVIPLYQPGDTKLKELQLFAKSPVKMVEHYKGHDNLEDQVQETTVVYKARPLVQVTAELVTYLDQMNHSTLMLKDAEPSYEANTDSSRVNYRQRTTTSRWSPIQQDHRDVEDYFDTETLPDLEEPTASPRGPSLAPASAPSLPPAFFLPPSAVDGTFSDETLSTKVHVNQRKSRNTKRQHQRKNKTKLDE